MALFRCLNCSYEQHAPDEDLGKNAKCPKCQTFSPVIAVDDFVLGIRAKLESTPITFFNAPKIYPDGSESTAPSNEDLHTTVKAEHEMPKGFVLDDWSWKELMLLRIFENVLFWASGPSVFVALIMGIRYMENRTDSIVPCAYFLSFGIAALFTSVSFKALRMITELTKLISINTFEAKDEVRAMRKNVDEITELISINTFEAKDEVRAMGKNVDEITSSVSEIADNTTASGS